MRCYEIKGNKRRISWGKNNGDKKEWRRGEDVNGYVKKKIGSKKRIGENEWIRKRNEKRIRKERMRRNMMGLNMGKIILNRRKRVRGVRGMKEVWNGNKRNKNKRRNGSGNKKMRWN